MATTCPKCNTENTQDSQFCKKCATPLPIEKAQPSLTKTLETPAEELTRGTLFAERYEIIEELGSGGMGKVYRVEDKKIGEEIALKLIRPEISADKKTIERFSNELKTARKIRHKNICGMYDLGEEKGTHYITMEYVSGEDLKRFIRRVVQLPSGKTISIAIQICEGLEEAHSLGIIHRDLKSNNIMIDDNGNARIMDFGIARTVKGKGITGSGVMIGTPEYMSPEQAEAKEVDQRSDIYSLGIILYEMMTGQLPFEGETPLVIAMKHKGEAPKNPKEYNAQITEDLGQLILKCLAKDKTNRYQSTKDVLSELVKIEKGIPTTERVATKKKSHTSEEITVTVKKRWALIALPILFLFVAVSIFMIIKGRKQIFPQGVKTLVVLPFENQGPDEEEFFVDGITDELRSRLSSLQDLVVISRYSAVQYKNSRPSTRQIREELNNVDYLLVGTVSWNRGAKEEEKVKIIPELIRTIDDTQLWSTPYEAVRADIFEVQAEIVDQVANAMGITLNESELKALEISPTGNIEAHNYYLRGNSYYFRNYGVKDQVVAIDMYKKAIKLDPSFALAYAQLGRIHTLLFWVFYDRTEARLNEAKEAIDRALELEPNLVEAFWALGFYYGEGFMDWDRALEYFNKAITLRPNNSEILYGIGLIQRRQGKFEKALANMKRAFEISPLNYNIAVEIVGTSQLLRRYEEAEVYLNRAISLAPEFAGRYRSKARLYLCWNGRIDLARKVIEAAIVNQNLDEASFDSTLFILDLYERNFEVALERLSLKLGDSDNLTFFIPKALRLALVYRHMNKKKEAQASFDSARIHLEEKVKELPDDVRFHISLGIAYAGLDRKQEAIREGELAVELMPLSLDAYRGLNYIEELAKIYVMVGEYDKAIDKLDFLLHRPGKLTTHLLRLDPSWDPLRDKTRFRELIEND